MELSFISKFVEWRGLRRREYLSALPIWQGIKVKDRFVATHLTLRRIGCSQLDTPLGKDVLLLQDLAGTKEFRGLFLSTRPAFLRKRLHLIREYCRPESQHLHQLPVALHATSMVSSAVSHRAIPTTAFTHYHAEVVPVAVVSYPYRRIAASFRT